MTLHQWLFLILFGLCCGSMFLAILLMFYIGRTRIKEIDKAVYGFEFPHDSIFALMIRVPNYASGFIWKWSARRSGLQGKIEHFDAKFRWPFIAAFFLSALGSISAIVSILFGKYSGFI